MNGKLALGIMAGVAASTAAVFAGTNEMAALRSELEDVGARLAALEKSGASATAQKPGWAERISLKGDVRYRFEYQEREGGTDKNRQRFRARIGAYADVNDFTAAGIRLRTGKAAGSGNQTAGDDFDAKGVYLDLAYIALNPQSGRYGEVTLGKMKYPWKTASALIWDSDVNPEGVAYNHGATFGNTGVFASLGGLKVRETSATHDLNLLAAQGGASQPLGEKIRATLGGSFFAYGNAKDFVDPASPPTVNYAVDYRIAEGFAEIALIDVLPVPVKLFGDYVNNVALGTGDQGICAGIKVGDARKGSWEATAEYRYLEENAAPSYFADSDFVGGGTDIRGIGVKAAYNLGKHLAVGIAASTGQTIKSKIDKSVVHFDIIACF